MGIKVNEPMVVPELKYENVYILSFRASQQKAQKQVFRLEYEYILYALKPDGTKVFDDKSYTKDVIEDFEETIKNASSEQEQLDLYSSINAIEQAISTLIRIRQGLDSTIT